MATRFATPHYFVRLPQQLTGTYFHTRLESKLFFNISILIHTTYNTGMASYTIRNGNPTTKIPYITNRAPTHFLHHLQYDTITDATYNTTTCITYSTIQKDYLLYLLC